MDPRNPFGNTPPDKREDIVLANIEAGGAGDTGLTGHYWIEIPSAKIRWLSGIGIRPSNAGSDVGTFDPAATMTVTAYQGMRQGSSDALPVPLQVLASAQALPWSYEAQSAVRLIRVDYDLALTSNVDGAVVASTSFEPAPGVEMSDAERGFWFGRCKVRPGRQPGPLQANS
jgi:hypothetical protein